MLKPYSNGIVSRNEEGYTFHITDYFQSSSKNMEELETILTEMLTHMEIVCEVLEKSSDEEFLKNKDDISKQFKDLHLFLQSFTKSFLKNKNLLNTIVKERDVIQESLSNDIEELVDILLKTTRR